MAYGRGENLPYFGKQGNIMPYSPREPKRKAIRGFPGVSDIPKRGKEPDTGLFSFTYVPAGILLSNEKFIRGWFTSIDCILIFDGMFYFNHEIRRDGLHPMVFMHVMNYFFYKLAFLLVGYLK